METDADSSGNVNSTYVYLEFNGKLPSDISQSQVFLRIANLHKKNPLVQVNDILFKGTYDWSIGTNLFFKESEGNSHTVSAFEKQGPVSLKYFSSSTKLLNLHQVKIPHTKARIQNKIKNINYKLTWDYNELLQKLENHTLRIEDIFSSEGEWEPQTQSMEVEEEEEDDDDIPISTNNPVVEPETDPYLEENDEHTLEIIIPSQTLEEDYKQLNILASRPVKRAASPELLANCEEKYEQVFEYHNIERKVLQPRDGYKSEALQVNEDTFSDCVDIDRCIFYGLIPPSSDFPRVLTKKEKEKLLTLDNFDNLSLAARYYVLQTVVKDLQTYIQNANPTEVEEKDEYGRTPIQSLKIYKKLTEAVKNRLQEIKYSLENDNLKNVESEMSV